MDERTHGGIYPDVERVDMVIAQMPILGFGEYYIEAVQAARDALANRSTEPPQHVHQCYLGHPHPGYLCLCESPCGAKFRPTGGEQP